MLYRVKVMQDVTTCKKFEYQHYNEDGCMTTEFFSRLSYSIGNEDWKTEQQALRINPEDRVLCITGSGDRPLNLLMNPCREIVCIDANKIQNYLLSLKCAAMQELDFADYLSFLGGAPDDNRIDKLKQVGHHLHDDASKFWLKNKKLIVKGILYQGAIERWVKKGAIFFSLFKKAQIARLFAFDNIEEQREFIRNHWDRPLFRKTFEFALSPLFTKLFMNDPGLYKHLGEAIHPGSYIYERMNTGFNRYLAKESVLASLVLTGKVPQEAFSPYLTSHGTEIIKTRLDRLTIKTTDLLSYLESVPDSYFDCFSISDVISYLSQEDFVRLLRSLCRVAKPGTRFCMRQFLSYYDIPQDLQSTFVRDHTLEKKLEEEDRCFVYRFMVGTIKKAI